MPLRILHLGSPTGLYGAERWILALVRHLDPGRIDSWIAAIKDDPSLEVPLCREAQRLGLKTHVFEAYGKANFSAVSQLKNFIRQHDIQIIHAHGYKTDLIGLLATKGTPCGIVTTPHGWTQNPDLKLRCYEMLDRLIFPFMDAVVALSKGLYNSIARIPGIKNKLHLILNGVDFSEIDNNKQVTDQIVSLKAQGFFIIGYIGRLIHGKGLDVLLHAVSKLKSVAWQLVLIGEGEQGDELEDLARSLGIKDSVHFLGFREDRISFLKGFDLFVLPSRSEGTPRCLMEAMASRVPAIASDIAGCRVLIDHGKTGMLFPVDDADALAERIEKVAADKILRKSLSKAAREFVEQNFSAERMAREYEALYMGLAQSSKLKAER